MLSVDQLVGGTLGEYQIERLLGRGELGAAYMAQQLSQGRTVMITTFNFPGGISARERDQFTAYFAQERATLVRLTHPAILPIYDFGEQSGYLYLVTAFVRAASLAQVLKQQGRFTPNQTLDVLKQLASGLDYAHSKGAVHGILGLSNVLISNELTVQIAGFGLRTMLEVLGNTQHKHLQVSLFSTSGTFLGSPEYISPERVQGMSVDARSDIYALGVMLFGLLSGTLPFSGANPLDIALKRLQQPIPSVHKVCPDVPEALDLVMSKILECDPAQRYQCAGDIAATFERILLLLEALERPAASPAQQLAQGPQITLPPTINWFEEGGIPSEKWQLMPPIVTGHMSAIASSSSSEKAAQVGTASWQMSPSATEQAGSPAEMLLAKEVLPSPSGGHPDSMQGVDPFALWFATSAESETATPGMFTRRPTASLSTGRTRPRPRPAQADRRRLVKLIVVGTATAGVLGIGGISFAHFMQSVEQLKSRVANAPTTGPTQTTQTTQGNTPGVTPTQGTQKQSTPKAQPSPTVHPTQQPTPKPTQQPTPRPTPTPTPPGHTGTVIGYTNQATNSAKSFTNPADGNGGLLVHLGNGNFVACERACTHVGVPVNYDAGSGKLVCPAHGAIFDPLNGFSYVPGSGPSGLSPLPQASIRINNDGTITTG